MEKKVISPEQVQMELVSPVEQQNEMLQNGLDQVNVFRLQDLPDERKDLIRRHRLWLDTIQKEYPMPMTPYRIGVYIRYFNQTKYKDYLNYHKKQFQDTIGLCPQWTLVDFYVDYGISAPNMESSPEWCRLLGDCFSGKVNLIITQKISNVTRKPESITLISRLLASQKEPVGIYFISEDLFTMASYYQRDLFETDFLPEGMNILPDTESDHLLPGGLEVASDDE